MDSESPNLAKISSVIVQEFRKANLTYDQSRQVFKTARKALGLSASRKGRTLPKSLTEAQIDALLNVITDTSDHLMFRLAYSCGLRVSAICDLKTCDVDLENCTIRIEWNKTNSGVIPFPRSLQVLLKMHLMAHRDSVFLFQSPVKSASGGAKRFTTRTLQLKFKHYARIAGLPGDASIHALRHSCLTHLAAKGLTSSQLQGISLHRSKSSLDSYVRLSAAEVKDVYQQVMK